MEIGSSKSPLNMLANLTRNSPANVVGPSEANQKVAAAKSQITESVLYHASDEYILSSSKVTGNKAKIYQMVFEDNFTETPAERFKRKTEAMALLNNGLADVSADLKRVYDRVVEGLPKELVNKDWGFSVTENGKITLTEGHDKLTDREKHVLEHRLNDKSLESAAASFADLVIRALELDRGQGKSSAGIGRYNLTRSNFNDTIDLKSFLDAPITGVYSKKYETLNDKNDFRGLYWGTRGVIESQLAANSVEKYKPKMVEVTGG